MNLLEACADPNLFGPWFRDPASWTAWRTFLRALFGLRPEPGDRDTFQACTGRSVLPDQPAHEAWLICGRRSGKSFILALIAVYLAAFKDWRPSCSRASVAPSWCSPLTAVRRG